MNVDLDEGQRQLVLLALALMSRLRPGFKFAASQVAALLGTDGPAMFEQLWGYNDNVSPQPSAFDGGDPPTPAAGTGGA